MNACSIMMIAGEPSGDLLAAELAGALREQWIKSLAANVELKLFGAGGERMAEAGVDVVFDMTQYAVVGLVEVLKNYGKFKSLFNALLAVAMARKPDAIICVDFSGFNRRFAHAVKERVRSGACGDWNPKLIQFVSPQVWASRPGRAEKMALDFDLLLAIFPFEKAWYAQRTPTFHVEFVGHPILDRYAGNPPINCNEKRSDELPLVALLPGSRKGELRRHLPVICEALSLIEKAKRVRHIFVLPNADLLDYAKKLSAGYPHLVMQTGGLPDVLAKADLAIASTGTVTLECAYFGVPTIALYKTSWSTYQIGKRIIKVNYLAMPNLLANEPIFPEYIQDAATPKNLARESLEFLGNSERRNSVRAKLARVIESLGGPGASRRAAEALFSLLHENLNAEKE
jgi:lipid-A-disaccharide synthase